VRMDRDDISGPAMAPTIPSTWMGYFLTELLSTSVIECRLIAAASGSGSKFLRTASPPRWRRRR
jgi:hypothetical protein